VNLRRLARFAPWAVIAVVLIVTLMIGIHRASVPASLDARVRSIAAGIRCPTCAGQTVADSDTFAAKAIDADIAQRLRARETPGQIRAYLVSRYGTSILESPPMHGLTGLIWVLPVIVIAAAAIALGVHLGRSRRGTRASPTDEDRELVATQLQLARKDTTRNIIET